MSNEKQITYWNEVAGPKWVGLGDAMEERLAAVNELLLTHCAARPGERVLDIGCGTGITAAPLAEAVLPGGQVTGIDISTPMLDSARLRCAGQRNLNFLQADAQTHSFDMKFDLLTSRFGVMFFEDPLAAFTNLRDALALDGRLCFVCWAGLADNPHWSLAFDVAVAALGPPEPKPPHTPGPMAFSDVGYLRGFLDRAGFAEISIRPVRVPIIGKTVADEARIAGMIGPAGALLDEKQADPATRARLTVDFAAAIQPFNTPGGPRLQATVLVVQAR